MKNKLKYEPRVTRIHWNDYHHNLSIYILDVLRLFQDHPKYLFGITESCIVEMLKLEPIPFVNLEAQVKMALSDLCGKGYVRFINNGYRALGPFAKLANARSLNQHSMAWNRISVMLLS